MDPRRNVIRPRKPKVRSVPSSNSRTDSILAIDPGLNNPALALFRRGRLHAASRVKPEASWSSLNVGERCRRIGVVLHDWACDNGLDMDAMLEAALKDQGDFPDEARELRQTHGIVALVTEWPQIYRAGKSKGNPNDLPPMVGVSMTLAGRLDVPVTAYLPVEWLHGQCPKAESGDPWRSPRGQRVWTALDRDERNNVIPSHDAIDAVGIGLFYLGRFDARRLFPGST